MLTEQLLRLTIVAAPVALMIPEIIHQKADVTMIHSQIRAMNAQQFQLHHHRGMQVRAISLAVYLRVIYGAQNKHSRKVELRGRAVTSMTVVIFVTQQAVTARLHNIIP